MANKTADAISDGEGLPWNIPSIRIWEINENSTHYDKLVAAPPDEDMVKMWLSWCSAVATTSKVAAGWSTGF